MCLLDDMPVPANGSKEMKRRAVRGIRAAKHQSMMQTDEFTVQPAKLLHGGCGNSVERTVSEGPSISSLCEGQHIRFSK